MERNKQPFYYMLYQSRTMLMDEDGNSTGQWAVEYAPPVKMKASISTATGKTQAEMFGNSQNYDKIIITEDMSCPIDENSVLFLDKTPEYDPETGAPLFDYIVREVSRSLNFISYAVNKVNVS